MLQISKATAVAIENVQSVIRSVDPSHSTKVIIHPDIISLYGTQMPARLNKEFHGENDDSRKTAVIKEASEMVQVHGHLVSAMIGKDVTAKDLREGTTFWGKRQSGRGPYLYKKIVRMILGDSLWANRTASLLFRGPFKDLFETVCGGICFYMDTLEWFRLYLLTGTILSF